MRPEIRVDRYAPSDLPSMYEVCVRTADNGEDATARYGDPDLVGHLAMAPYVELEPELAFVLRPMPTEGTAQAGRPGERGDDRPCDHGDSRPIEHGPGRPVGYVVGTADTLAFEAALEERWWPRLRDRYPADLPYRPADARHVHTIHHPPVRARPWLEDYPAHLHIDLLPQARGGGHGRALLERFFAELRTRAVPGVHLGVSGTNTNAVGFYRHLGLVVLEQDADALTMGATLSG